MTELTIPDVIGVEPDRMEDNMVDETVFSPDLDLALIVGSEKTRPEKERILVSSVVLRFASPVFAAMLSPPWKESQGLSTKKGSIMEIELPEDNATAMKFICAILHHQNNDKIVKEVPSGRTFLHVAILTDKYDFYRALKFVLVSVMKAASYASPLKDRAPKSELQEVGFATDDLHKRQLLAWPDLLDFAAAAYLLNDCEWFSKFAFDLMAVHRGSFAEFLLDDLVSSVLPPRFAVLLGERALQFRLNVLKDMQERLKSDSEYHSPCPAGEFITEAFEDFVAEFHNTSTDDGFCKSLASLLYELEDLAGEDRSFLEEDCEIDGKRHDDSFPSHYFSLEIELKDLKMRAVLCINLVRLRPSCNAGHIHR